MSSLEKKSIKWVQLQLGGRDGSALDLKDIS